MRKFNRILAVSLMLLVFSTSGLAGDPQLPGDEPPCSEGQVCATGDPQLPGTYLLIIWRVIFGI